MRLARNHGCIKEVCFADKFCDKSCSRLFVDFIRTTDLQHLPLIHHCNTVGNGQRFALIMRYKNKGNADLVVQFIVNQRTGNGNPLLLPTGKLGRLFVDMRIKLHQMQIFFNLPVNFFLRAFANPKRKGNVFIH